MNLFGVSSLISLSFLTSSSKSITWLEICQLIWSCFSPDVCTVGSFSFGQLVSIFSCYLHCYQLPATYNLLYVSTSNILVFPTSRWMSVCSMSVTTCNPTLIWQTLEKSHINHFILWGRYLVWTFSILDIKQNEVVIRAMLNSYCIFMVV